MSERKFNIVYESSIERLTEINSSFDRGILRVAYTGKNRNKSFISKDTFEKCIDTIYNCPIVCNYNRETDSIGSHDVEVVKSSKGMKLINITQPVGVVPESANYWWETIEEDNGEVHEYLCVDIIIWKRQEAYSKIKENGITDESMEIKVKSGQTIDGYYHIDSFEFTAFCLLESAEPCYESACIEVFSLSEFQSQYSKMMSEFKEHFSTVNTSKEDDINPQNITQNLSKGGKISLSKIALLTEYGLTIDALDFDINDFTEDELRVKFEQLKNDGTKTFDDEGDPESDGGAEDGQDGEDGENADDTEGEGAGTGDDDNEGESGETGGGGTEGGNTEGGNTEGGNTEGGESDADTDDDDKKKKNKFSLSGEQFREQLIEALSAEKYTDPFWGDMCKYMYIDYDTELSEVYCYDCEDWKLYGFKYSMNGDNIVIDFECKKKKKFSIVDFDEGNSDFDYKYAFESYGKVIVASKDAEISKAKEEFAQIKAELDELKKYQKSKMDDERKQAEEELFAQFSDINGVEAFEHLRSNCSEMSIEDIENKCFEIRGRNTTTLNFSANKPKSTRILVDKQNVNDEPYGGLFIKYSSNTN